MTATSDFMVDGQLYGAADGSENGSAVLLRWLCRLVGVALILAAMGLWLSPGANWSSDILLMKIGVSAASLMVGFRLLIAKPKDEQAEIEIDTARHELRMVRTGAMGANVVLQRCSFGQLARVERSANMLKFWDQNGEFLADVHVTEQRIMDMLLSGLRDSGQAV